MKTSNKILLGLLVVIYTVPFLLAISLKSKIKKGEYTVEKDDRKRSTNVRSGTITAFKVVKVIAPDPELLRCHLKLSQAMDYKYYKTNNNDSVMVFTGNDTLYIQYIAAPRKDNESEERQHEHFEVNVHLPAFNNLVVDGATVIIDSSNNLSVTIKNYGVIKDAGKLKDDEIVKVSPVESIKTDKEVPVAQVIKEDVSSGNDYGKGQTIKNRILQIADFNIKDILTFRFEL